MIGDHFIGWEKPARSGLRNQKDPCAETCLVFTGVALFIRHSPVIYVPISTAVKSGAWYAKGRKCKDRDGSMEGIERFNLTGQKQDLQERNGELSEGLRS
jgi:hypothetical protein